MYPHSHFLTGLAIGGIGVHFGYFAGYEALLIAMLATIVDIDHYLLSIKNNKSLSVKRAWQGAVIKNDKRERSSLHHWRGFVVCMIIIIATGLINETWAIILAIAYISHFFLDHIFLKTKTVDFSVVGYPFKMPKYEIVFDLVLLVICLLTLY